MAAARHENNIGGATHHENRSRTRNSGSPDNRRRHRLARHRAGLRAASPAASFPPATTTSPPTAKTDDDGDGGIVISTPTPLPTSSVSDMVERVRPAVVKIFRPRIPALRHRLWLHIRHRSHQKDRLSSHQLPRRRGRTQTSGHGQRLRLVRTQDRLPRRPPRSRRPPNLLRRVHQCSTSRTPTSSAPETRS